MPRLPPCTHRCPSCALLRGAVSEIRDVLWSDGPDTVWSPDTLAYIAEVLYVSGLGPQTIRVPGDLPDIWRPANRRPAKGSTS